MSSYALGCTLECTWRSKEKRRNDAYLGNKRDRVFVYLYFRFLFLLDEKRVMFLLYHFFAKGAEPPVKTLSLFPAS